MKCRHCNSDVSLTFVDLGSAPPSNAYLTETTLHAPEKWFPLRVLVCEHCRLVQTEDFSRAKELFDTDYAYFSSFSTTWLAHSEQYTDEVMQRFSLDASSHVVEIAANDGYLLQFFMDRGVPCTGVEPTASTAAAAREKGIPVIEDFFGVQLASKMAHENRQPDLMIANNVLAHVPDINDFVKGFATLLKPQGVATFEFPYLLNLINANQFDTIYHEHFSYLSLTAVEHIFTANGLSAFDVEELTTHGGSLRVYAQCVDGGQREIGRSVEVLLQKERDAGIDDNALYSGFQERTDKAKNDFLAFLVEAKRLGKTVAAYGAAAKGNTLLNFAGVRPDLISFVADRNPAKQGNFMPGSRIPITAESEISLAKPAYIIILPWNLREEITQQLDYIRNWSGQFVTAIPALEVS